MQGHGDPRRRGRHRSLFKLQFEELMNFRPKQSVKTCTEEGRESLRFPNTHSCTPSLLTITFTPRTLARCSAPSAPTSQTPTRGPHPSSCSSDPQTPTRAPRPRCLPRSNPSLALRSPPQVSQAAESAGEISSAVTNEALGRHSPT